MSGSLWGLAGSIWPESGLARRARLFIGSARAGQRAATIISLVQSAKLNGHDPYRHLKDILERLPAHPGNRLEELLPHRWKPASTLQ